MPQLLVSSKSANFFVFLGKYRYSDPPSMLEIETFFGFLQKNCNKMSSFDIKEIGDV
jgi:hypothetical protein